MSNRSIVRAAGVLVGVMLLIASSSYLRAQGGDPASVVASYYAALKANDYARAATFVEGSLSASQAASSFGELAGPTTFGPAPPSMKKPAVMACNSNLKNLGTALEMYSTDYSGRYPRGTAALTPNYLRTIPTCPTAHRDTYTESYRAHANPDAYTIFCSGKNHADLGWPANYPQYTSYQGLVDGGPIPEEKPRNVWAIDSFKVLDSKVEGDRATVRVEEVYRLYGFPTRVFATLPLRQAGGGWRIDGAAVPRSQQLIELLSAPNDSRAQLYNWLRVEGIGASFAALRTALSSPAAQKAIGKRNLDACGLNLKNIGTANEMYSTDNSGRYAPRLSMLAPNYLKTIPSCPSAGRDTYTANYAQSLRPDCFTVFCGGSHHTTAGAPPNYPQYNSFQGLRSE